MTMPTTEHEHTFGLFGTDVLLLVSCAVPSAVVQGLITGPVRNRLEAIHRALSRFDPGSELSRSA